MIKHAFLKILIPKFRKSDENLGYNEFLKIITLSVSSFNIRQCEPGFNKPAVNRGRKRSVSTTFSMTSYNIV